LGLLKQKEHLIMETTSIQQDIIRNAKLLSEIKHPSFLHIPLHQKPSPSIIEIKRIMELLRKVIFPGFFGPEEEAKLDYLEHYMGVYLEKLYTLLEQQIYYGLCFEKTCDCPKLRAKEVATDFINAIPKLKAYLSTDVKAIQDGDPAAYSESEIIFCYPAITAILHQRVAHFLWNEKVPVLPRIITEMAHSETGIDIHPGAQIGEYFSIDHGTGIVIGQTAIIGNHVRLYQGVTLGAKSFTLDDQGLPMDVPRHPILEDHVTIYSNASILGRIIIGEGSVIGGNIWLTHNIPPYSKIIQSKAFENHTKIR